MPVLWAHQTEEELDAMDARIRAAVPPERMPVMLRLMLPAMSTAEHAGLLSTARAQMPPPVFAQLSGLPGRSSGPSGGSAPPGESGSTPEPERAVRPG